MLAQLPLPIPAPAVPPAPFPNPLPVPFVQQCQTLWCWAACAAMVLRFYRKNVRQCEIVSLLSNPAACSFPQNFNFGCLNSLFPHIYAHFGVGITPTGGPVQAETLAGEITAGRPVELGFADGGGNGHVVIAYGFDSDLGFFIHDPDEQQDTGTVAFLKIQAGMMTGTWVATWINMQPLP